MGLLNQAELKKIGFKNVGANVAISNKASFYGAERISIGNNVRIDDFCVLSAGKGGIEIGSFVHIAIYSSLIGAGKITISDYANISSRVSIYSSTDDYSGASMTNPTISSAFTNVQHADVVIDKHVIVGCGSVLLPGVHVAQGVAIGALSLIKRDCEAFFIYAGNPAKKIKPRDRNLLVVENNFLNSIK